MAGRVELGKTRHVEVRYLRVQQAIRRRGIEIKKVRGGRNPADMLNKPKRLHDMKALLELVSIAVEES